MACTPWLTYTSDIGGRVDVLNSHCSPFFCSYIIKIKIIPEAHCGKHCKGTFHARLLVATEKKKKLKKSMPVVLGR